MKYYVYILCNKSNTVLYIGYTSNLTSRILQHKYHLKKGFSDKYNVTKLIYFEEYKYVDQAKRREKQLKNWHRSWKINLIKKQNLQFIDLYNLPRDPETSSGIKKDL